mmetsp:Transcript_110731/g.313275  ORF Transcript_110731/g.313275 Transcript_110731/m.313275 type:complete len:385 (-) Transcript_110731:307-1461(-)
MLLVAAGDARERQRPPHREDHPEDGARHEGPPPGRGPSRLRGPERQGGPVHRRAARERHRQGREPAVLRGGLLPLARDARVQAVARVGGRPAAPGPHRGPPPRGREAAGRGRPPRPRQGGRSLGGELPVPHAGARGLALHGGQHRHGPGGGEAGRHRPRRGGGPALHEERLRAEPPVEGRESQAAHLLRRRRHQRQPGSSPGGRRYCHRCWGAGGRRGRERGAGPRGARRRGRLPVPVQEDLPDHHTQLLLGLLLQLRLPAARRGGLLPLHSHPAADRGRRHGVLLVPRGLLLADAPAVPEPDAGVLRRGVRAPHEAVRRRAARSRARRGRQALAGRARLDSYEVKQIGSGELPGDAGVTAGMTHLCHVCFFHVLAQLCPSSRR